MSKVQWCSGYSGPKPGMRGGLTLQRTHSSVRWFKTVPSRKLGDPIAARAVRRGPARDSPSLTGQGSNSATCRTRRVSLRRQGRVVCSRGWAVPFTNLFFSFQFKRLQINNSHGERQKGHYNRKTRMHYVQYPDQPANHPKHLYPAPHPRPSA